MNRTAMAAVLAAAMLCACSDDKPATQSSTASADADKAAAARAANAEPTLKILRWGPESTPAGQTFNLQPNGISAVWFQMEGVVQPGTMEAWMGDRKLELGITSNQGGGILVPSELLAQPGKQPVYLVHAPTKKRYDLGTFEVLPGPQAAPKLRFIRWGPESTPAGQVFNRQPNGVSALWFEMDGAIHPGTMQGWMGNSKLELTITSNRGGSMIVPTKLLAKPGKFPVYLLHVPTKTRYDLGTFEVLASSTGKAAAKGRP